MVAARTTLKYLLAAVIVVVVATHRGRKAPFSGEPQASASQTSHAPEFWEETWACHHDSGAKDALWGVKVDVLGSAQLSNVWGASGAL